MTTRTWLSAVAVSMAMAMVWGCGGSRGDDDETASDADTDADSDGDADTDTGTDSDTATGTDTGTGTDPGNDCTGDGVWYDEISGLCWQKPPSSSIMEWSAAISYCDELEQGWHTDWRLPSIDELISLIRGCQDGTVTWDLSPSLCEMTPEGCVPTDSCTGTSNCDYCLYMSGPGAGDCYWDPTQGGPCRCYWSLSPYGSDRAWGVCFDFGDVVNSPVSASSAVRCVR